MLQDTIDKKRDMLKAFLNAEIKGWNDAVADPADGGQARGRRTTARTRSSTSPGRPSSRGTARTSWSVSADTKTNGLFTLTDALQAKIIKAIAADGHHDHRRRSCST